MWVCEWFYTCIINPHFTSKNQEKYADTESALVHHFSKKIKPDIHITICINVDFYGYGNKSNFFKWIEVDSENITDYVLYVQKKIFVHQILQSIGAIFARFFGYFIIIHGSTLKKNLKQWNNMLLYCILCVYNYHNQKKFFESYY